tara:strand:+ start:44 stop:325 length:282 start_codon:yes stop_codon:yes gene_type:complete
LADEPKLRDALLRREQAEQILTNPLFAEICNGLDEQIIQRWRSASTEEEARGLWLAMKAHSNFMRALRASVRDGEIAEFDLERASNERSRDRG